MVYGIDHARLVKELLKMRPREDFCENIIKLSNSG